MLIHTDQKPFQCDQCDQSFRQKQLLKRHQNLYHNPAYVPPPPKEKTHECPECGRSFRHKGNLIRHMALHDPDSTAAEKAIALKIGRQKKIQIIDGQQVEVLTGEDSEDDMDDIEDGIPMQSEDGQRYVVLEVIQLSDQAGGTQQAMIQIGGPGPSGLQANSNNHSYSLLEEGSVILPPIMEESEEHNLMDSSGLSVEDLKIKKEQERANCYGFDDDSDSD